MSAAIDSASMANMIQNYNYPLPTGGVPSQSQPPLVEGYEELLVGISGGESSSRAALLERKADLVGTALESENLPETSESRNPRSEASENGTDERLHELDETWRDAAHERAVNYHNPRLDAAENGTDDRLHELDETWRDAAHERALNYQGVNRQEDLGGLLDVEA
ncbi:MAG: hypothetical protein ACQERR_02160 [Pseudomonadota bacterium]